MRQKLTKPSWQKNALLGLLLLGLYGLTHFVQLTLLPVFADEAIYIRWAQLIIDDWSRYLFFPLNDGKTPLFMWLLVPFQSIGTDQLWAARLPAVGVGLGQVLAIGWLTKALGGKTKTIWATMLMTTVLPFWFFHHRLALIDGFLSLWLTLALTFAIKIAQSSRGLWSNRWQIVGLGVTLGLALLTKLPAILAVPSLMLVTFWPPKINLRQRSNITLALSAGVVIAGGLFAALKLHPAFGQLFSRGSDFLYPWQDVLLGGLWQKTVPNLPTYVNYFISYLTAPILILALIGLFIERGKRTAHLLWWSAWLFVLPIALLGRVVYPRYLLPAAIFLTPAAMLALENILTTWVGAKATLVSKSLVGLAAAMLIANTLATSGVFIALALTNPNNLPLVPADRTQYLTEWSSGHGLVETVELIRHQLGRGSLAVATEGYFGTLPDGLLLYFHHRQVDGLYIEGIGQPVASIPPTFSTKAAKYDRIWLVVNSHRLPMDMTAAKLITEYCRPDSAPCLQVWDITNLIKR